MALNTRPNEQTGLLFGNEVNRTVRVGDNEIGQRQQQTVKVTTVGRIVSTPNTTHGETNFYIEQSKEYFPNSIMWKFCTFPYFTCVTTVCCLFLLATMVTLTVLIGVLYMDHPAMSACLGLSAVGVVCCVPLYCVFYQHCCVICCTVPTVLSQPVRAGLINRNEHMEVAINCEEALYLRGKGGVVGVASQARETVRIQVLSQRAADKIRGARRFSRLCCLYACVFALWAPTMLALSIVYFVHSGIQTLTPSE